jgi:hypothetical protein
MEKYAILLGYFDKQWDLIQRLEKQLKTIDLSNYDQRYVFALKAQQFYTAIEDLFKQIAKAFENHIEDLSSYHKELLIRLNTEIPGIRPRVISKETYLLLDKIRSFRHFIRHAYDCELSESELVKIQSSLSTQAQALEKDLQEFRKFVSNL